MNSSESEISYYGCLEGISKKLLDDLSISRVFILNHIDFRNQQGVKNRFVKSFNDSNYLVQKYAKKINPEFNDIEGIVSSLLFVPVTISEMEKKNRDIRISKKVRYSLHNHIPGTVDKSFSELLSAFQVQKYASIINNFLPYYEIVGKGHMILSPNEILKSNHLSMHSLQVLEEGILPLLDLSIAQQSMMSGDLLIQSIYEVFKQWYQTKKNKADFELAVKTLLSNDILRENFLSFYVKKSFRILSTYKLVKNDSIEAKRYFSMSDKLRIENESIVLTIGGGEFKLPNYEYVKNGKVKQSVQLFTLE